MDARADSKAAYPWLRNYPAGIDWHVDLPAKPLYALFDEAAARFGARPCLDFLDRKFTYEEIGRNINAMAAGLQELGIGRGHRVGIFLPNTPHFVITYYAILKTGATVVNFNPLYSERDIAHQIDDAGVELMVTLDLTALYDKLVPMFETTCLKRLVICRMADVLPFAKKVLFPLLRRHDRATVPEDERHIPFARLVGHQRQPKLPELDPLRDIAVLQYTGGTTGVPKAAMLTHANLYANALQGRYWFVSAVEGQEKLLGVLPLFHVFAMTVVMNLSINIGAEIILLPRFELYQVLQTIHTKRPTMFPAVPTIYMAVANHRDRAKFDLSSINFCISGGAPLPVEVKEAFERVTGCALGEGYGLTEASPVVACNPLFGVNKNGSIGLPLPGSIVEIISLEDGESPMPLGEKGELCVRGPQVMAGYWNHPEDTARDLRNGRLHTGDVAYMDEDGYIFIVDRIKDLILCGGHNVYPRHVEEAIYLHPAVGECVVAGVPDPFRGQVVKAYVKLIDGASLSQKELLDFLEDKLSPLQRPRLVEFREQLPHTLVGKLSRKELLEEEKARAAASAMSSAEPIG